MYRSWSLADAGRPAPLKPLAVLRIVLLLLALRLSCGALVQNVSTSAELAAALLDDRVTRIVLVPAAGSSSQYGDVKLDAANFPQTMQNPCHIRRNVTLTSQPAYAILDWDFLAERCVVDNATVTLQNLVSLNARYGYGVRIDFFAYSPTGALVMRDVVRRRMACATEPSTEELRMLGRPAGYPGEQQATVAYDMCARGRCYNKTVFYQDIVFRATVAVDQRDAGGGYVVWLVGTWAACDFIVPPDCVAKRGPDACVVEAIDAMRSGRDPVEALAQGTGPIPSSIGPNGSSSFTVPVALVVVPVVLGLLLLAAAVGLFTLLVRRRKRLQQQRQAAGDPEKPFNGGLAPLGSGPPDGSGSGAGRDASGSSYSSLVAPQPSQASQQPFPPLSESSHWRILAAQTAQGAGGAKADSGSITLGPLLGAGSFGRVYKGRFMGQDVAVKVLLHGSQAAARVAEECKLVLNLRHPNICAGLYFVTWQLGSPPPQAALGRQPSDDVLASTGVIATTTVDQWATRSPEHGTSYSQGARDRENDARTWVVLEYCSEGSLFESLGIMTTWRGRTTYLPLLCRLLEVAHAMRYLHMQGLLHGDLKAPNVLLAADPAAPFGVTAKVCDFGLSRALMNGQTHRSTRSLGTVTHMAPELLRSGHMSGQSDVYSFGILVWELLTGRPAFKGMHFGEIVERVCLRHERPRLPDNAPEDIRMLCEVCWAPDATLRPGFGAICECLRLMHAQCLDEAVQSGQFDLVQAASPSTTLAAGSLLPASSAHSVPPTQQADSSSRCDLCVCIAQTRSHSRAVHPAGSQVSSGGHSGRVHSGHNHSGGHGSAHSVLHYSGAFTMPRHAHTHEPAPPSAANVQLSAAGSLPLPAPPPPLASESCAFLSAILQQQHAGQLSCELCGGGCCERAGQQQALLDQQDGPRDL